MKSLDAHQVGLSNEAATILLDNRSRFLAFLERRVGSSTVAEEVLQDAYAKAVERGSQLRDDETVLAWFFRILRNAVIDQHRRHGTASRGLERFALELETVGPGHDEIEREICACVSGVLDTLKAEYRDVIRAVDLGGADVPTFAAQTSITPNNASVRLHRAREALGRRLRQTCGACATHGCVDCACQH